MPKYFTESEFNRCTPSCSMKDMDNDFLLLLDKLREKCGFPLVISCAYRSKEWDLKKGRSGNSAHTRGKAVDIRYNSSSTAYAIVKNAMELGIKRIGVGKNFIHIDNDDSLPQNVLFNYY